jgi:hypothetical protein
MTDRIRHLTITLDEDTRTDDLDSIVSAILHIRGVANVERHVVRFEDHLAREAVRAEIRHDLHEAIERAFNRKGLERSLAERKDRDKA